MGHPGLQLGVHALKEVINQQSLSLLRNTSSLHTSLWTHCVSEALHRNLAITHQYVGVDWSASSCSKQSGYCPPTCDSDETTLPKIHWRGSYQFHSRGHSLNTQNQHINMHQPANNQRSLVLESSFNFESMIFQFRW